MTEARVNVEALVAALDAQRKEKGLSWRKLAQQADVQPSTLTRMNQGKKPDVNTLSKLVSWLGMSTEEFIDKGTSGAKTTPEAMAVASVLLRGRRKMSNEALKALEELVQAAKKLTKELG